LTNAGGGWSHSQRSDPRGFHIVIFSNTAITSNVFFRNNIFSGSQSSNSGAIYISNSSSLSGISLDYNDLFITVGDFAFLATPGNHYT
ncbi:hypothetical protein, partial [Streptococcus pneumoniae]|uniref:hypothetical protein n=1 Tax=Streptococcus pneumoniae TaxID=1313 RepID=UPI001E45A605